MDSRFQHVRDLFPISRQRTFLFAGNFAPCATPVRDAIDRYMQLWTDEGDACWAAGREAYEECRRLFARLIGAEKREVVGVPNTSTGIATVAQMLSIPDGANIVVGASDHQANTMPWLPMRARGVEIRIAESDGHRIPVESYARHIDDKTVVVNICHVSPWTGFKADLAGIAEAAHSVNALTVVDAAQSVGAVRIDVRRDGVDVLASSAFKWLLGPAGAGFLYVRGDLIGDLRSPSAGWFGTRAPWDKDPLNPELLDSAQKFQTGSPSLISFVGAQAALEMIHDLGIDLIEHRILSLSGYLIRTLLDNGIEVWTPTEEAERAGVVVLRVGDGQKTSASLKAELIDVGYLPGLDVIRSDPGIFNSESDIDVFVTALDRLNRG